VEAKVDILIVGHGITGANFNLAARKRGLSTFVIDQPKNNRSSSVAVGLFHPMAFRDSKYAWAGKDTYEEALDFYRSIDPDAKLVQELLLYRVLSSTEEYNRWRQRMTEPAFEDEFDFAGKLDHIEAPHGLGKVRSCAKLDVSAFLQHSISTQADHYSQHDFDYAALNGNCYQSADLKIEFNRLVFCEGLGVKNNPWFNWLPFKPAKGDVLRVRLSEPLKAAVNKKHFFAPGMDNTQWLGATYNWNCDEAEPEMDAAEELMEVGRSFYKEKIVPLEHLAGIRPASFDRRPFVGKADEEEYYVLNGMGSKACLLAPKCSHILLDYMSGNGKVPSEMAMERVRKYLSKKAN
jgi:glycine oxidase